MFPRCEDCELLRIPYHLSDGRPRCECPNPEDRDPVMYCVACKCSFYYKRGPCRCGAEQPICMDFREVCA